ncbi:D-alanyl-D-alanine carboxypeptidase [Streptomyces sp. CA-111067]|uniref:D-alanyl-D-alanine carboxypeptidase n=1 Tax=Streptomyces sp. CA-111067 TaxID=3240046 RepID=UPI003D97B86C
MTAPPPPPQEPVSAANTPTTAPEPPDASPAPSTPPPAPSQAPPRDEQPPSDEPPADETPAEDGPAGDPAEPDAPADGPEDQGADAAEDDEVDAAGADDSAEDSADDSAEDSGDDPGDGSPVDAEPEPEPEPEPESEPQPAAEDGDGPEDAAPAEAAAPAAKAAGESPAEGDGAGPAADADARAEREARRSVLRPLVSDLPTAQALGVARPAGIGAVAPPAPKEGAGRVEEPPVGPEGTRGMPVPLTPDAPLKLLAELTNTPPPRQTPLRSVVRRFKIWTPLVVLLAIIFCVVQTLRPIPSPSMKLTSAASYTFAGTPLPQSLPWPDQGQSVAEVEGLGSLGVHGAQTPMPIASVTKVMTAYVILRDHPLSGKETGPMIPVDAQAAAESTSSDESIAVVKAGQKFSERQMLQLLLVPSGNNIARLLARWDAGTQGAFVTKMMKAAHDLGMTNTTYTGASGVESSTKSTAVDQLKLARAAMKNDVFRSVVALPNVDVPGVGTIYNNNNDLVNPGVIGIKTGSTTPAGGALMWAAQKKVAGKEQLILGVVLQQHGGATVFDDLTIALTKSQALINGVQGGLTSATVVKKGQVVGQIDDGLGGKTPVVAQKDLVAIGWPGMKAGVSLTTESGGLPHSAKAGTPVGTISFGSGSARTSVPVVLQDDLDKPSFGTKLLRTS